MSRVCSFFGGLFTLVFLALGAFFIFLGVVAKSGVRGISGWDTAILTECKVHLMEGLSADDKSDVRECMLQCVAACCSVLQCVALCVRGCEVDLLKGLLSDDDLAVRECVLQHVAACCSVLSVVQRGATCGSVLQCFAVCGSVW